MRKAASSKAVGKWEPGPAIKVEVDCHLPLHLIKAVEQFSGLTVEPDGETGFLAFECRITEATLRNLLQSEGLLPLLDAMPPSGASAPEPAAPFSVHADSSEEEQEEEDNMETGASTAAIEEFTRTQRAPGKKRKIEGNLLS